MRGLETAYGQIEHGEINYDAHTNTVRLRMVCQYSPLHTIRKQLQKRNKRMKSVRNANSV